MQHQHCSRLQELAVLGANDTNTLNDHEAINWKRKQLRKFNRLMSSNTYKGRTFLWIQPTVSLSQWVAVAEMTFGIGEFDYSELYGDARTVETGLQMLVLMSI